MRMAYLVKGFGPSETEVVGMEMSRGMVGGATGRGGGLERRLYSLVGGRGS
jgi:hypothetical protein